MLETKTAMKNGSVRVLQFEALQSSKKVKKTETLHSDMLQLSALKNECTCDSANISDLVTSEY